jgi:hypothetical protein
MDSRHIVKQGQLKARVVREDDTVVDSRGPDAQEARSSLPVRVLKVRDATLDDTVHVQFFQGKQAVQTPEDSAIFLQLVGVAGDKPQSQTSATSTVLT